MKTQDALVLRGLWTDLAIYAKERLWDAYERNKSLGLDANAELVLQELLKFERKLRQLRLWDEEG